MPSVLSRAAPSAERSAVDHLGATMWEEAGEDQPGEYVAAVHATVAENADNMKVGHSYAS